VHTPLRCAVVRCGEMAGALELGRTRSGVEHRWWCWWGGSVFSFPALSPTSPERYNPSAERWRRDVRPLRASGVPATVAGVVATFAAFVDGNGERSSAGFAGRRERLTARCRTCASHNASGPPGRGGLSAKVGAMSRSYEFSPEWRKRKALQRKRQEARWAARSGPVTVRKVEQPSTSCEHPTDRNSDTSQGAP
jgi:hypothetical protein